MRLLKTPHHKLLTLFSKVALILILLRCSIFLRTFLGYEIILNDQVILQTCRNPVSLDFIVLKSNKGKPYLELDSSDQIGISKNFVYGRSTCDSNYYCINIDYTNKYFAIDTVNDVLYLGNNIDELSKKCGISPGLFNSTYKISYYYHFNRLIGEVTK